MKNSLQPSQKKLVLIGVGLSPQSDKQIYTSSQMMSEHYNNEGILVELRLTHDSRNSSLTMARNLEKHGFGIYIIVDNPECWTYVKNRRESSWQVYFWFDEKVRNPPLNIQAEELLNSKDGATDIFLSAFQRLQSATMN